MLINLNMELNKNYILDISVKENSNLHVEISKTQLYVENKTEKLTDVIITFRLPMFMVKYNHFKSYFGKLTFNSTHNYKMVMMTKNAERIKPKKEERGFSYEIEFHPKTIKFVIKKLKKDIRLTNIKYQILPNDDFHLLNKNKLFLIIGGSEISHKNTDELSIGEIKDYATNVCYNLRIYLEKMGYTTISIPATTGSYKADYYKILPIFNHAIDINQRGFRKKPISFFNQIESHVTGKTCAICDHNKFQMPLDLDYGKQDILFYMIDNKITNDRSYFLGPPANHELFFPNQPDFNDELNIIVNQSNNLHDRTDNDKLKFVLDQLFLECEKNNKIKITRYAWYDDVINFNDPYIGRENYTIIKDRLKMDEKAELQNKCHVFISIRKETLGLSIIEALMSGCLVLFFGDQLKHQFISKYPHKRMTYYRDFDFHNIYNKIDKKMISDRRDFVVNSSWQKFVEGMVDILEK